MWVIHNAVVRATSEPKTDYGKLKKRINRATLGYGSALTTMYFITQGAEQGVSASLGVLSSFVYISLLERHVDNIEKSLFQSFNLHLQIGSCSLHVPLLRHVLVVGPTRSKPKLHL